MTKVRLYVFLKSDNELAGDAMTLEEAGVKDLVDLQLRIANTVSSSEGTFSLYRDQSSNYIIPTRNIEYIEVEVLDSE